MLNIKWNKLEKFGKSILAFGRKNTTSLMTGGGIILGWTAVYIFWKESRKADEAIAIKQSELPEGETVPTKEKIITYLQYCWISLLLGLGSTGLEIWAHELDLSKITEMYVVTKFLEDKNAKQGKLIEKMEGEMKEKQVREMKSELIDEEYPKEEIEKHLSHFDYGDGSNNTLFILRGTDQRFYGDIVKVTSGIAEANQVLKNKRKKMIESKIFKDPFYAKGDTPFPEPECTEDYAYSDIYSSMSLATVLAYIGAIDKEDKNQRIADELLEVRYYGGADPLPPTDILFYKDYIGPGGGLPAVCYIDLSDYLLPTNELMERCPI